MDKNYRDAKISDAMHRLVMGEKLLRERIAEAAPIVSIASGFPEGFEEEFRVLKECLGSVKHGDFSRVTREQLHTIAQTIMAMYRRIPGV